MSRKTVLRIKFKRTAYRAWPITMALMLFATLLNPTNVQAQIQSTCDQRYTVALINGVWSTTPKALGNFKETQILLGDSYKGSSIEYELLHNYSPGISLLDLLETYRQRSVELDNTHTISNDMSWFWQIARNSNRRKLVISKYNPAIDIIFDALRTDVFLSMSRQIVQKSDKITIHDYEINKLKV